MQHGTTRKIRLKQSGKHQGVIVACHLIKCRRVKRCAAKIWLQKQFFSDAEIQNAEKQIIR